jgi:hypothetical protein
MADDPFRKAREEMERAQSAFHEATRHAQEAIREAMEAGQKLIAEAAAEFHERLEAARRPTNRPPRKPPRGKPDGAPTRRGPRPGGPQPTPVRSPNPSFLSGGAEAPLDE